MKYPTENGVALSPWELSLPESHTNRENNHHAHFTSRKFGQLAVTQCLRDLERHQYALPVDTHRWIHDTFEPPELPTEEQAAKEIIDAYEKGEMFKRYNHHSKEYFYQDIPLDLVDGLMAKYSLQRMFAAD